MFTYCFVDKYGIQTPTEFAYDRDMEYLKNKVDNIKYFELIILSRIF